jgi:hypothetical protein
MSDDAEILESTYAKFIQSFIDFRDGFIATVWEAEDQAQVEKELQRLGFPYVGLHHIDLARNRADLES